MEMCFCGHEKEEHAEGMSCCECDCDYYEPIGEDEEDNYDWGDSPESMPHYNYWPK